MGLCIYVPSGSIGVFMSGVPLWAFWLYWGYL